MQISLISDGVKGPYQWRPQGPSLGQISFSRLIDPITCMNYFKIFILLSYLPTTWPDLKDPAKSNRPEKYPASGVLDVGVQWPLLGHETEAN